MATHTVKDLHLHVDTAALKTLYETQPIRHVAALALNWLIIGSSAFLSATFSHPVLYILTVLIIGARMHALTILMHDAAHFRFLKNRTWSDRITNLTSMYPLFSSIESYRQNHLRHHRHLNTDDDPDWFVKLGRKEFTFPKTRREFLLIILSYFTLIQGLKDALWFLKRFSPKSQPTAKKSKKNSYVRLGFYLVLFFSLTFMAGGWKIYALYWVVPYFSTFFMFQYIRSVAEHFGELGYDHALTSTRTIKVNPVERFLLAPHNVSYHLEHHLYPGVPFYHLPQLHQLLMKSEVYQEKAHITLGFWKGLMYELGAATLTSDPPTLRPA